LKDFEHISPHALNEFEGWTIVGVSGDITDPPGRSTRVRFIVRSPDGSHKMNLYLENEDFDMGMDCYVSTPAEGFIHHAWEPKNDSGIVE
jgi:hypothetical protein